MIVERAVLREGDELPCAQKNLLYVEDSESHPEGDVIAIWYLRPKEGRNVSV